MILRGEKDSKARAVICELVHQEDDGAPQRRRRAHDDAVHDSVGREEETAGVASVK